MRMCFRGAAIVCLVVASVTQPLEAQRPAKSSAPPTPNAPSPEAIAWQLAEVFERAGDLLKAQEQFATAARSSDPKTRTAAVEGLNRVSQAIRRDADATALVLATELERLGRWDQARTEYAAAARATHGATQQSAIEGLRRVDAKLSWDRAAAVGDSALVWTGKIVGVVLLAIWIPTLVAWVFTTRRGIKVFPFIAPNEESTKAILFWLGHARSKLRAAPAPLPGAVLMAAASSLPYINLPNLPPAVTEIADLEVGGTKVGLKDALNIFAREKTRISGAWVHGSTAGQAYAEIERRGWWVYRFQSRVTRPIRIAPNQAGDLELFGYDVLIHAIDAHGS